MCTQIFYNQNGKFLLHKNFPFWNGLSDRDGWFFFFGKKKNHPSLSIRSLEFFAKNSRISSKYKM